MAYAVASSAVLVAVFVVVAILNGGDFSLVLVGVVLLVTFSGVAWIARSEWQRFVAAAKLEHPVAVRVGTVTKIGKDRTGTWIRLALESSEAPALRLTTRGYDRWSRTGDRMAVQVYGTGGKVVVLARNERTGRIASATTRFRRQSIIG